MFPKFQLLFDDSDVLGGPSGASDSKSDLDILNEGDETPASEETTAEEPAVFDELGEVTFEDEPVEEEKEKVEAKPVRT